MSQLTVEINVAHPQYKKLFQSCKTAQERADAHEGISRDVVLDCYQHAFQLEDLPEKIHESIMTDQDPVKRAAEICLNFDKALRIALSEKEKAVSATK